MSHWLQRKGTQGTGGEAGHSCGARSPHWSWANTDKDLGYLVFLLCPYSLSPRTYTYIPQHLQCHFGAAWSSNYVTALSFICLPSGSREQCGFAKATIKSHKKGYPTV